MLDLVAVALAVLLGAHQPGPVVSAFGLPDVTFRPRDRAVSNWRTEAAAHLATSYGTAANILLGRDPPAVSRCVRLNNYWCIKKAGWAGEIASDREGHVAFASAAEGADVAALLLRRYYVDYGRHSALAIIAHWAPASCGFGSGLGGGAGPRSGAAADRLAVHGVGRTLRARFLAAHGRRVAGGGAGRMRRSVVPDRLIGATLPAPAIAVGLGEAPVSLAGRALASLPTGSLIAGPSAASLGSGPAQGAGSGLNCLSDGQRVKDYAAKAAAGVAASPGDDLRLFDAAGRPTATLARVMLNMSAVEIGPLGASRSFVAAAVDHAAASATANPPPKPAPVAAR